MIGRAPFVSTSRPMRGAISALVSSIIVMPPKTVSRDKPRSPPMVVPKMVRLENVVPHPMICVTPSPAITVRRRRLVGAVSVASAVTVRDVQGNGGARRTGGRSLAKVLRRNGPGSAMSPRDAPTNGDHISPSLTFGGGRLWAMRYPRCARAVRVAASGMPARIDQEGLRAPAASSAGARVALGRAAFRETSHR